MADRDNFILGELRNSATSMTRLVGNVDVITCSGWTKNFRVERFQVWAESRALDRIRPHSLVGWVFTVREGAAYPVTWGDLACSVVVVDPTTTVETAFGGSPTHPATLACSASTSDLGPPCGVTAPESISLLDNA